MKTSHSSKSITVEETSKEIFDVVINNVSHTFEKSELRELMQIIDNAIL